MRRVFGLPLVTAVLVAGSAAGAPAAINVQTCGQHAPALAGAEISIAADGAFCAPDAAGVSQLDAPVFVHSLWAAIGGRPRASLGGQLTSTGVMVYTVKRAWPNRYGDAVISITPPPSATGTTGQLPPVPAGECSLKSPTGELIVSGDGAFCRQRKTKPGIDRAEVGAAFRRAFAPGQTTVSPLVLEGYLTKDRKAMLITLVEAGNPGTAPSTLNVELVPAVQ